MAKGGKISDSQQTHNILSYLSESANTEHTFNFHFFFDQRRTHVVHHFCSHALAMPQIRPSKLAISCFLLGNLDCHVSSWSPPIPHDKSFPGAPLINDRRTALARIGFVSASMTADLLWVGPGIAIAEVTPTTGKAPTAFDTYIVVPDAGVNLNPKLEKIDVSADTDRNSGSSIVRL